MFEQDLSDKMKTWIVVGVVSFVTFIIVFLLCNALVNGGKKQEKPSNDSSQKDVIPTYSAYKLGDLIKLKDDSEWNVIYDSKASSEYVTLLSKENVNSSVVYGNIVGYLKAEYKNKLISNLEAKSTDIQEVRLLAYLDLSNISNQDSNKFLPDTPLKEFNIPEFIYESETVTDTTYTVEDKINAIGICKEENDKPVRFCLLKTEDVVPIRPVITISKKLIKNDNSVEKTEK